MFNFEPPKTPDLNSMKFKQDAQTYAENLLYRLNEISETLKDNERVGINIGFAGQILTLRLKNIKSRDCNFIIFECEDENKDEYYIIQSAQQINVLVTKIKVKDESIPRKIGFTQ